MFKALKSVPYLHISQSKNDLRPESDLPQLVTGQAHHEEGPSVNISYFDLRTEKEILLVHRAMMEESCNQKRDQYCIQR